MGDLMNKYMDSTRFHYWHNIVVYRAKSGESCQFGTSPNEAVMFQLKSYNANVLSSTRARCSLTLDLFSLGKVISMHLKKRAPPGMEKVGPGSCHAQAMSLFRRAIVSGSVCLPEAQLNTLWTRGQRCRKRPARALSQAPPRKRAKAMK